LADTRTKQDALCQVLGLVMLVSLEGILIEVEHRSDVV
jgi:hypothetical protein